MEYLPVILEGIPLFGTIPAGNPVDAVAEPTELLEGSESLFGASPGTLPFALKVQGNSMANAGIHSGDTVVLEQRVPSDQEIVAALVDQKSILKRYVIEHSQAFARSERSQLILTGDARAALSRAGFIVVDWC